MMKRAHTALEYKAIIRKLRQARPNIQFSSDFIVGFPGETQADFEQTMNLIAQVNFDTSFSFIYSSRPGTPAADMVDDVSEEEKKTASVPAARTDQPAGDAVQPPYAGHRAAYSGRRHLTQEPDGTLWPHRMQPDGQL
ncbi:hypothetical protein HA402_000628 [Bradysia odoriphaga]|nr:hypothetical protein HA402_000628 [Bradysia odoriphaga]